MSAGLTALAVSAMFGLAAPGARAQAPAGTPTTIVLGVGASTSQRTVAWYSTVNSPQAVQVVPTAQLVSGAFPATPTSFPATLAANVGTNTGFNGRATITGLQESTAYSYRVGAEGAWSPTYEFKTHKFDGTFDFLVVGDPQIGSSGDVAKDGAGWNDTLDVALAANPDAELIDSVGDQVETANNEPQYNAFFASDKLRQYPLAATIGNHDVGAKNYEQHFATPNTDLSPAYYASTNTAGTSGGDYWYIFKGVLFMHLNSNAYANGADAAHIAFITKVLQDHKAEAKYTVVTYHHSIYSPALHANDGDNKQRRLDFPTAFSRLGIDLVLQGHDHAYSRSYALKDGKKANADEQPGASTVTEGPGGVIYVTASSASGSKYYDLTTPVANSDFGPDPLDPAGKRHFANSVENQEYVRSYVKVSVGKDGLVVQALRSGTCAYPNSSTEPGRSSAGKCVNDAAAKPVGSTIDRVAIYRNATSVPTPVGGSVPATLGVSLGTSPSFSPFLPGVGGDYLATLTASITSSANDATLTVADPSETATGRLVNGTYSLPSVLQAKASSPAAGAGGPFANVGGAAAPTPLLGYAAPVSNDPASIAFQQHIGATDPLRTGTYSKTLVVTLSTTNP